MRQVHEYVAKDGTVSYRIRFRLNNKQSSETFDTKRQAEQFAKWLDALGPQGALDKLYAGEQKAHVPTLNTVAEDHITHLTGIESGTRLNYRRLWNRTWAPLIGDLPADDTNITRDAVAAATNQLATHYAHKSLKNQRGLLSAVIARAVEQGHMTKSPTKRLRLPRGQANGGEEAEEMTLLEMRDFDVLAAAFSERYRPLVRFLVGTGCRWGEVVVLRKRDLHLTGMPNVRFRRALKWSPDGKRIIGVTKTVKSRRTVALPAELVPELLELTEGRQADDLVFTSARGGMIQHRTFWSDHWRPSIWRAQHCPEHTEENCKCGTAHPKRCWHSEMPGPCGCAGTLTQTPRIHDLRHTHASWLLAAGVPIHVVQARLGHESIQTTVDRYGHLLPDAQLQAAQAAALAFRPLELHA